MPFPYDQVDDATTLDDAKGMEPPCPGCKGSGEGDAGDCPCAECGGTVRGVQDFGRLFTWCEKCTPIVRMKK